MKISEIQRKVVDEKAALLIRPRKTHTTQDWVKGKVIEYDVKPLFTGKKKGWILLDLFTANAMVTCYEAIKDTEKWDRIPVNRLVNFVWKVVT